MVPFCGVEVVVYIQIPADKMVPSVANKMKIVTGDAVGRVYHCPMIFMFLDFKMGLQYTYAIVT